MPPSRRGHWQFPRKARTASAGTALRREDCWRGARSPSSLLRQLMADVRCRLMEATPGDAAGPWWVLCAVSLKAVKAHDCWLGFWISLVA